MKVRKALNSEALWINQKYEEVKFVPSDLGRELVAIAEVDGEKAGLGRLVHVEGNDYELGGMYVFEKFRGKGVAGEIVSFLLKDIQPAWNIFCLPFKHLESFYRAQGFDPCEKANPKVEKKFRWCDETYPHGTLLFKLSDEAKENYRQLQQMDEVISASGAQGAMEYLSRHRRDYHWVGVYKLSGDTLELGAYVGPHTDHTRIPVGRGVCGTAVKENANIIVDDVSARENYLACNLDTKSEIVVLIRDPDSGKILGQIDVDGKRIKQFSSRDEIFLNGVAKKLAPLL